MSARDSSEIDTRDLRRAFGHFATGVTIVTTIDGDGNPVGFTANSFSSVSIDPPLLLVNIATAAHGCPVFTAAGGFAVNILAHRQRELSNRFASAGSDKFAGVDWQSGPAGAPILDGVVAWFDCRAYRQVEAGDHVILIGEVQAYDYGSDAPLGFCRGAYVSFGLPPQMLQLVSSPGRLNVGAIVSDGSSVLLEQVEGGMLRLPVAEAVGDVDDRFSLTGKLASAGIHVELPFIYSAFHDNGTRFVYYLGELRSVEDAEETRELHFWDLDGIPWDMIGDAAIRIMLERFVREQKLGNYAIYIGDAAKGEIFPA